MCGKTTCRNCGKATWSGCGNHIEQALAGVSKSQRCVCDENSSAPSSGEDFFARFRGR